MAIAVDETVGNAMLDAIESTIGASPTLEIRTGTTIGAGTLLASIALPSDWLAAASGFTAAKAGTWSDSTADSSGTPGNFVIKQDSTVLLQGTAGVGSGDLSFDTTISLGGTVTISSFSISLNATNQI